MVYNVRMKGKKKERLDRLNELQKLQKLLEEQENKEKPIGYEIIDSASLTSGFKISNGTNFKSL